MGYHTLGFTWSLHFLKNTIPGHFQAFSRPESHFPGPFYVQDTFYLTNSKEKLKVNLLSKKSWSEKGSFYSIEKIFILNFLYKLYFYNWPLFIIVFIHRKNVGSDSVVVLRPCYSTLPESLAMGSLT